MRQEPANQQTCAADAEAVELSPELDAVATAVVKLLVYDLEPAVKKKTTKKKTKRKRDEDGKAA